MILEQLDWAEGNLEYLRSWRGVEEGSSFTLWKRIKSLARAHRVRVHGRFGRGQRKGSTVEARKALGVVAKVCPDVSAIVLARDTDGHKERAEGYRETRKDESRPWQVVLALPHPELESWLLNGFEPCSLEEEMRLDELRRELGFDPRERSDELNAGAETDKTGAPIKRSTKRLLDTLTGGVEERRRACWSETSLASLRERGKASMLAAYLLEVEKKLGPLIGGR